MTTLSSPPQQAPVHTPVEAAAEGPRRANPAHALAVERRDIAFFNVAPGRVRIEITVHNRGSTVSRPTIATIQSASFGVFLPWQPLTTVPVPSIPPGARRVVATEVDQHRLAREFAGDGPPQPPGVLAPDGLFDADPRDPRSFNAAGSDGIRQASTSGRRQRSWHWMGNLNVFLGRSTVERHRAQGLRCYPGRQNTASFCIGALAHEEYRFSFSDSPLRAHATVVMLSTPIVLDEWMPLVVSGHQRVSMELPGAFGRQVERSMTTIGLRLVLDIPQDLTQGQVELTVQRLHAADEAVVEFTLDANAQGPGCYVV